ncbi:MAG TPA: M56 family metallopeptidase [Streptosporangiaceae bacterium]|nr:M56 family metallopeptidase [Streptosporangiaceae bacterium]
MDVLIYVPIAVSALGAFGGWPLAERLPPRTATWLLTVSALVLAATSCAALGLLAMAAAMRLPAVATLGGMSLRAVGRLDPATLPVGVIAAALFGVAALASVRAAWLRVAALVAARRETGHLAGDGLSAAREQVLTIDDDSVDAYAVPGRPGRIVITSGMMDALSESEREALLAHERAHVSACHYVFTALVRLAAAANPLLRPLAAAVNYSVERWADERAASVTGSRPLVAHTVAKAALAAAAAPARRTSSAAVLANLTGPSQLGSRGSVPRRVDALLGPPPRSSIVLLALAVAVLAVCGLAAIEAAGDVHGMVELAQAALS